MPNDQDDTNQNFIKQLFPWSEQIPEICLIKTKMKTRPLIGRPTLELVLMVYLYDKGDRRMNRRRAAVVNGSIGLISQIIMTLFQFIIRTFFLKYIGITILGINNTFASILGMLSLSEMGFQTAIIYNLYKPLVNADYKAISENISLIKIIYRFITLFIFIASCTCLPFLQFVLTDTEMTLTIYIMFILQAINVVVTYLFAYKRTLLYADQHQYIAQIFDLTIGTIFNILKIIIIVRFKNYFAYLIIQIAQTFFCNIAIHIFCKQKYSYLYKCRWNSRLFASVYGDVKNVFVGKIAGYVYNSTDNLVVSTLISTTAVGYLGNYTIMTGGIKTIYGSILNPITPIIGSMIAENDNYVKWEKIFRLYTRIRYILTCMIVTPLIVLMNDFIRIWIGDEYILPNMILYLLAIDLFIHLLHGACCDFINGAGLFRIAKYIGIIGVAINIILSIFCSIRLGLLGVLVGTVVSQFFFWFSRSYAIYKYVFHMSLKMYIKYWVSNLVYILVILVMIFLSKKLCFMLSFSNLMIAFVGRVFISEAIVIIVLIIFVCSTIEKKELMYILGNIWKRS